jgi:hypothetical protein
VLTVRRLGLATAASAALAWTGRSEAKPAQDIELRWVAPAGCPGSDEVRTRVRRLLGDDAPGASSQEKVIAEGTVQEVGGHYRLSLTVKPSQTARAGAPRVFESTSCESLAGAAAVTLALLARGQASTDRGDSPTPPDASREHSSASNRATSAASAPASPAASEPGSSSALPGPSAPPGGPSRDSSGAETASTTPGTVAEHEPTTVARWSPAVRLPVLVSDAGALPSPGYGLGFGAGVRVRRLKIILSGVLWLPQNEAGASPYAATYERRTGELSGCYTWRYGPFEGGPCLTMTLEDVTADGSGGGVIDRHGHVSWLTLGLGAEAGWRVAGWATLFVRPVVSVTTSRPTFAIDGVGPLYEVPLAAVGVQIGSEWIF